MAYDPKAWVDGELITAEDLNRLEQAVDAVDEAQGDTAEELAAVTVALDGKVDTTDARLTDARTPTAHKHPLADLTGITIDRTVGTRVLIDGLMVYGETPKRDVTSMFKSGLAPENTGLVVMYRRGTRAVLELKSVLLRQGAGAITWPSIIPVGWMPTERLTSLSATRHNSTDKMQVLTFSGQDLYWTAELTVSSTIQSTFTRPNVAVRGQIEWEASGWPASLPGIPA